MDEVDLIAKIPSSFEEMVESKNWKERKEALDNVIAIAEKYDAYDPKASYHRLCDQLKQIIAKDANIHVAAAAAKLVTLLSNGLNAKFKDYGTPFIPIIFEKFKEKKLILRDALIEMIDAVGKHVSFDNILDDVVKAMEKPNPAQKSQIDLFFSRYLASFRSTNAPKKVIKAITPVLTKHCTDPDSEVRESAMTCLGVIMFVIGEKDLTKMVGELPQDSLKWAKIQEIKTEVEKKSKEMDAAKTSSKSKKKAKSESESENEIDEDEVEKVEEKEIDPFDELTPVDVISKLPDNFFTDVESKKWTERRDALQVLLNLCNSHKKLDPKGSFGDIIPILKRILEKDANINVAALSAKCLSAFAYGLRQKFGPFVPGIAGTIFEKFKEKKPILRDPLIELIDNIAAYSCSVESIQEDICTALDKQNPNIKAQVSLFLQRVFKTKNSTTLPKKFVKEVAPFLIKIIGVSDPEARDSAYAALGALQRIVGDKAINSIMGEVASDKVKMGKIKEFCDKMIEENGPAVCEMVQSVHKSDPMKPLPKTALSSNETDENEGVNEKKDVKKKKPLGTKNTKSPTSTDDNTPGEVVLSSNSNKSQRFKDEAKLKLLKWQFEVPQPDHLQQLQSQLKEVTSNDLYDKLYNTKDFKQQLKALDILISVCNSDPEAIVANSDLLLKWITLRILETNPTVLMKCLEFGQQISKIYLEKELTLHDVELSSFMPFLLLKTGDTKEPIRIAVKKFVFDMCDITADVKVYGYLIDALKTKNSRMKTECLNIMEILIDRSYGDIVSVHPASFKVIAGSISDRDNNVRNAALNCFVAVYRSVGNDIYKLAGKLPDKDKAYLEERIKRSGVQEIGQRSGPNGGKAKIVKPVAPPVVVPHGGFTLNETFEESNLCNTEDYTESCIDIDIKPKRRLTTRLDEPMPYGDIYHVDIDAEFPDLDVDIAATDQPTVDKNRCESIAVSQLNLSPDILNEQNVKRPSLDMEQYHEYVTHLERLLQFILSPNLGEASDGISELFALLNNRGGFPLEVIKHRINEIVMCICKVIDIYKDNFVIQTPIPDNVASFCKNTFNVLLCVMNDPEYVEYMEPNTVCEFLSVILGCVSRSQTSSNDLWKNSIHSSLNHATVKLCENCNYNVMMMGIANCMTKHSTDNCNDKVFNLTRKCMDKLSTLTQKKNYEWDAEICLTAMNDVMKLFQNNQDKIYETTFHAIRNHIQRLIVVNKSRVKEAVDKNCHNRDKVWQYAARCLEKVMPNETAELDSTIMKINGMTNVEVVKFLSSKPVNSVEWDAFFESGKSQDSALYDEVVKVVKEKDSLLYESIKNKLIAGKSLKAGSGKLWSKDLLLSDSIYLTGSRLERLESQYKKSLEAIESISFATGPTRTQSIPPQGIVNPLRKTMNSHPNGSTLNQTINTVNNPVPQFKKPKRLSALDREALKEKLAQLRST
uniref:TOG domain-containing protein n=1 Tax=Parastrongyloides trichosuri TaxID=131310 RepID=A0A0N4ZF30_PARTI